MESAWTKEDVRILKKVYRNLPNTEVAALLDRTVDAVKKKASRLGITKTKKYLRSLGRKV